MPAGRDFFYFDVSFGVLWGSGGSEAVAGHDGLAVLGLVVEVFVVADAQKAAGHVVHVAETVALQGHDGVIAALADLAVDIHRAVFGDLVQAAAQLGQRDVHRRCDVALGIGGPRGARR